MIKLKLFILFFTVFVSAVSALPELEEILPEKEGLSKRLRRGEEISLFHNDEFSPQLTPKSVFSAELKEKTDAFNPNMAIEGLYLYPMENPGPEVMLKVVNILSSVSEMEGLTYYSASRDEIRLLFEQSYRVNNFEENKRVEDLHFTCMPERIDMKIHQKDLSFMHNDSTITIIPENNTIYMEQINRTPMRYSGIIRVISPGNFQTRVLVIPCTEGLLYYGIMGADTLNIKAFKERANNSFYNRMAALYGWFSKRLE